LNGLWAKMSSRSFDGIAADAGVVFDIGNTISWSIGISHLIPVSFTGFHWSYTDIQLGVGWAF